MRPAPEELQQLIARARAGCPEAARLLVERYTDPIRRVIRRHLHARLRSACDSIDVLQSVWKDFFGGPLHAEDFTTPERLVAFLCRMGLNKVHEAHRRALDAQKRCVRREVGCAAELPDPHTPPQEAVEASDQWQAFLVTFAPRWREAIAMLRDGHSQREAASHLGVSERTFARILERARARAHQRPA